MTVRPARKLPRLMGFGAPIHHLGIDGVLGQTIGNGSILVNMWTLHIV